VVSQGDIVLVPVPYTDLSTSSRRPVIVISRDDYNLVMQDMVVAAMTSNLVATPYSFVIDTPDLVAGFLNHPSRVRADRVYTLKQSLVIQTFGKVNTATLDRIRQLLADLVGP
jgi:mRNA interferase MazF